MAAGRIKGITIEIGGDTTGLVSALSKVDKQINATQTALKDVNKLLKLDPGNTELLEQKQKQLNEAIGLTKDRLDQLKDAQSQVAQGSAEWDALQREIIATEQDLGGLQKELSDFGSVAAQKLKVVGEKFQEVGGKIEAAGRQISKLSTIAAGALGGIAKMGYDAVVAADDLNTLSKQTGVSTDQLQKWSYAADLVDVSVDTITGSMKKMKKNLDSNSAAFDALGVRTKDNYGNMRDATDIFYDTIKALSQIENETERDIAAMDIFGKSADDLAGIIDDGGQALIAYGREAEQMGLIIGGDTLNKLNEANDTIDKMKATMGASLAQAGATIAQTFAPQLEKVAGYIDAIAEKIRTLTPEQTQMITTILAIVAALGPLVIIIGKVVSVVGGIMTHITTITSVLGALTGPIGIAVAAIGALAAAFVYFYNTNEEFAAKVNETVAGLKDKFSELWTTLQPILEELKQAFMDLMTALEPVFEAIMEYIAALLEGVMAALPAITTAVKNATQFITQIVQAFIALFNGDFDKFFEHLQNAGKSFFEMWKNIYKAGLDALTAFFNHFGIDIKAKIQSIVSNIISTWNNLVSSCRAYASSVADTIIDGIGRAIDWIKSLPSQAWNWGSDLIQNLIDGIRSKISGITDAISDVADVISSFIHFSEPDVGPLKNFHTFMPDMMKEMVNGINRSLPMLENAMSGMASTLVPGRTGASTSNSMTATNTFNINVNGAGKDVMQLANELTGIIQDNINAQIYNQEAVFA